MKATIDFCVRQARSRPLATIAAAFLLGVLAASGHTVPLAVCAALLALAIAACFALRGHRRAMALMLVPIGFAAGMARMTLALDAAPVVETRYSAQMVGRVAGQPFNNPDTGRLIAPFQLESIDGEPSDLRVRLYLRDEEPPVTGISYGQRLRLTGHLWKPDPVTNPYEFDFGAYLRRQGMAAYATAKRADVEILDQRRDIRTAIIEARQAVSGRIDALFPQSAAMMRALVLGDRSLLSEELRQSLNRTGTAHLISISGLHVTVLAALLALLLGRFMPKRAASLAAAVLLIPYGALIGFNAPFVRALTMFAILCLAPTVGLPSDSVTRLGAALLGYLLVNPLCVTDAGFVLSFSASAGILLLLPPLSALFGVDDARGRKPSPSLPRRLAKRTKRYMLSLLCASLAAQLATLPAVIAFFGVQSVVSLPFNLICVPLCMLGYVAGLFALLVSAVCMPLGVLVARVPDELFALLTAVTRWSGHIPAATVRFGRYAPALVLIHWLIVLAASELSRVRRTLRRFFPLALLAVAALASLLTLARAWPFSLVFLDADQADCAVVRTRGHTYLIDAGDTYTPAADFLNATCLHLDGVVLSHPHQDHAGGLEDVLDSFTPDAIYVPEGWFEAEGVSEAVTRGIEKARQMGVAIRELSAGDSVALSKAAQLDVYAPAHGERHEEINDMSMMGLVSCEGHAALFTGDLSAEAEPEVIPEADVLKVPHHGSAKAASDRLLNACAPRIAVISVGENSFGHPAEETLEKLDACGAQVLTTRELGAITLTLRGDDWQVQTFLEARNELE